ncbi:MAG: hypothetical protein H6733_17820 [Alphaproteobacteria bacterium]|nr:hypothetical protein [Alphaproteobacteria bacterium]
MISTRPIPALLLPVVLATGCSFLDPGEPPNCDPRTAFYPDVDGDGVGDGTDIYLGCEAPAGWVDVPPAEVDTEVQDTDDTDVQDTDTDVQDTDTDTDVPDTDTDAEA